MHKRIRHWAAMGTAGLLLSGLAMAATAQVPEEVSKGKATYAQKLQEIKQETEAAKPDLVNRYRKTLDALRLAAKQKGDLDAVLAVDGEIARFDKQKKLPPVTPPPANPEIAKAAANCREALEKTELDGARKVIDLTDRYLQFLDQHKTQAVRDEKLDVAKSYDAELKATRDLADYQAAKFLVAEKIAAAPPKADPPDTPAATDPKTPPVVASTNTPPPPVLAPTRIGKDGEKIQPHVDPEGLYDAVRIIEGQPPVTLGTPTSYKQLSSSETGKAPLSGGVGISMDGYLDGDNAQYQLRIRLRTKTAGTNFFNLKVIAQYFVKNPNGGEIQEARTQFALVSVLGGKGTTVELKMTSLPFSYTYRYRGGNYVEGREGAFLGTVVSVFSPEDRLLGQATSAGILKDKGKTAFELPRAWEDHVFEVAPGAVLPPGARPPRHRRDPGN